ncbi:MAG: protein kinase domain-containing protein [Plesiomonas sp.]|uniref:protein kinase domain-containing protein n=1 Tax=Plesiomonas sp. TaxID=2486279 RepID=UPI003F303421
MKRAPGLIKCDHQLDEKVARVLMRQAVQAAQHCIAHGVFHDFIDEENILINTNTLDIKLIDFGYSMPYMGKKYYRLGGEFCVLVVQCGNIFIETY